MVKTATDPPWMSSSMLVADTTSATTSAVLAGLAGLACKLIMSAVVSISNRKRLESMAEGAMTEPAMFGSLQTTCMQCMYGHPSMDTPEFVTQNRLTKVRMNAGNFDPNFGVVLLS